MEPSEQKILIIEDDREVGSTICKVLETIGYQVEFVENGIEGRRKIDDWQPDLVITDMMMPRMGGFPVLDYLCTLPEEQRPRVIMITANEGSRHRAYAELRGVDDYLRKPFAMDVLVESVEQALARKQEKASEASKNKRTRNSKNSS